MTEGDLVLWILKRRFFVFLVLEQLVREEVGEGEEAKGHDLAPAVLRVAEAVNWDFQRLALVLKLDDDLSVAELASFVDGNGEEHRCTRLLTEGILRAEEHLDVILGVDGQVRYEADEFSDLVVQSWLNGELILR